MPGVKRPVPFAIPFSAWIYVASSLLILLHQFLALPGAGWLAGLAMLVFLAREFPRQRRYAQVLFVVLAGGGLLAVAWSDRPITLFLDGWQRGAVYGAFFLALTTLRDAAETSALVRRCGRHLVEQPAGRRYAALAGGGHLFGIILSYGAIELLGAMVARANRVAGDVDTRGRRMLLAIQRGFCVMNCWNPLNLMTVVVSTAFPQAPMRALVPFAFLLSLGLMVVGWLDDRLRHARLTSTAATGGWSMHLRLVALVLSVMAASELASLALHVTLVAAVTLAVPLAALAWIAAQTGRFVDPVTPAAVGALLQRRIMRFLPRIPGFRGEATVLAGSGFMGVAVGAVVPPGLLAPWIEAMPADLVPLAIPVVLIATGQIGLNPIAIVALIGAAIPEPAALGLSPAALAFSCMLGWGLAVGMTPMSASALITARWAGVSPWVVGSRWNAAYTAGGLVLAWGAILLVA